MSKEKKPTAKSTTTTNEVKRGRGRPRKSVATTAPVPKSLEKLAAAKKAAKPVVTKNGKPAPGRVVKLDAKKPSEKAQATRELSKAVKGTNARPSTTPDHANLYDTKAAFELLQNQLNVIRRRGIGIQGDIKTILKTVDAQVNDLLGEVEKVQGKLDKQVRAYNADVRKPVEAAVEAKKPWYKKLRGGRA